MSIALDNNSNNRPGMMKGGDGGGGGGGGGGALPHGHGASRISMYESPGQKMMMMIGMIMQHQGNNNSLFEMGMKVEQQQQQQQPKQEEERKEEELDSCSSSSIGKNSDLCGGFSDKDDTTEEVQSSYKGPLDRMDSLEDVLPIRRGISKFYFGKSKSFTCLPCANSASSIKEIAKPENAYSKRRKNLLGSSLIWDKNRSLSPRSNGGGISKRSTINTSRSTLALAVAMSSSESLNSTSENSSSNSNSNSTSPSPPHILFPPLHPQSRSSSFHHEPLVSSPSMRQNNMNSWQSYTLADLADAGASVTASPGPLQLTKVRTIDDDDT